MEFKETLRAVDVLMIDDLQFLIGKDNTQEEFFHTFNALVDQGKQIVVSSDKPPSDLAGIEDRLRTRLGCGMVADIHATTYELRLSILEAKAAAAQVAVPPRVLELLAHKIATNIRELEGALNRLLAHANLFGRPVTVESAHEVLHDLLRAHEKRVSIEDIQKRVAEHYNIRLTDMSSARRARSVARPRQVAMYLAKHLTQRSLARDRPPLRQPRPHHGDARGLPHRGTDGRGRRLRRGRFAAAEDAGDLSRGRQRRGRIGRSTAVPAASRPYSVDSGAVRMAASRPGGDGSVGRDRARELGSRLG